MTSPSSADPPHLDLLRSPRIKDARPICVHGRAWREARGVSRASLVGLCALWGMLLGPNGGARKRRATSPEISPTFVARARRCRCDKAHGPNDAEGVADTTSKRLEGVRLVTASRSASAAEVGEISGLETPNGLHMRLTGGSSTRSRGGSAEVLGLEAVVESVVDPPEISNAHQRCTKLSLVRDGLGLPKECRETLDRANVLQSFEPFVPVPHSPKRRESPPTGDRAARPNAAFQDAAEPMERDRTTTSMAVSARPTAPGTTRFEDAQAPVLPSHPMRPR